ncbi:MAG: major facilitator superfamily domain-containing protein [Monoraphidium minutum]|nr:MAG: major facilitator superfamily domain-containing protein [Monoraphidium minutum]
MVFKKADLGEAIGLSAEEVAALRSAERKMAPRLLIMVAIFIAVNYLDRTNLALASVELTAALGLTPTTYGLGAALFFVSYCVLQMPSQVVMAYIERQNLWLSGLLVCWGTVATAMAGMKTIPQFLALRVLLGVFEAGALPALWTYLSHFYCKERLAVPLGVMMGTLIMSQAIGPLLAAGFLSMDGVGGFLGWQWLFLIEGLMAIVAAVGWAFMPHSVECIKALTPEEVAAVHASMARTHKPVKGGNQLKVLGAVLRNPTIAAVASMKFTRDVAFYGVVYWTPMIVKSILGFKSFGEAGGAHASASDGIRVVMLVAVPFACAACFQFVNAWHAQHTNERRFHLAGTWMFGALSLFMLPIAMKGSITAAFVVLVLAAVGTFGAEGIMVAHFMALQGGEKGLGMALINSAGGVGGFVGPMVIGAIKQHTGSYANAMLVLGAFLAFASILVASFDPKWAERWMLNSKQHQAADDVEGAPKIAAEDVELKPAARAPSGAKNVTATGGKAAAGARAFTPDVVESDDDTEAAGVPLP